MNVAFYSTKSFDRAYFDQYANEETIHYLEVGLAEKTTSLAKGCEVVCLFVSDRVTEKIMDLLHKLGVKLIALRSAGFNHIDLEAARKYQIQVVRVPAYSPHAIAEHAVALILTLNRKTHKAYNRVRDGNFSLERLVGFDLFGKTVGVIGTGKIGRVFCEIMIGFGCKICAFDLVENGPLKAKGVQYLPICELLGQSDIVSLHCPLNDATRHIINASSLKTMKMGAMLINRGRGGLIDSKVLVGALKSGKLAHVGLDVYEQEESIFAKDLSETIIPDDLILRLMTFPNVLITAHQAYLTEEALLEIAHVTMQNISAFAQGDVLLNEVKAK
jgi:D-lactate dehydrogenase